MKEVLKQLTAIWKQLGLNQRVTIVFATVGVLAGMAALVFWSNRTQMQLLYGRLSEKDVSEVVASIQEQGVACQVGGGGTAVYVPSDQVHRLRMQLASKGIPAGDGVGFEIFDRSNFGISDFVQRTNYVRALQGELSRTIAQLKGVRSARVMIVVPENRLLFAETKSKPTASVFIDEAPGALNAGGVNSIRFLVANSVEGLKVDDVTVVDSHGDVLSENLRDDSTLGIATGQMKYRKSIEDYFSGKVETMLANVLGPGNAVVRVSAEIDTDSSTKTEERYDPDGQVIRSETSTEDTTNTKENEAGPAAAVGVTSNVPASNNQDNSGKAGKNSEQVRKNKTDTYEINRTTTSAVKNPGGITRVSAAVFVAAKSQPRKPEEIESLRKMVVNALGIKADAAKDLDSLVTLQEVPFENQSATDSGKAQRGWGEMIYENGGLLRNLLSTVIAAALFGFFLFMLRRVKPDVIPAELLQTNGKSGSPIMGQHSAISPELLNELIRQKPENVGAALRGWMSGTERKN